MVKNHQPVTVIYGYFFWDHFMGYTIFILVNDG